jgi:PAS domain S-box-containing protein
MSKHEDVPSRDIDSAYPWNEVYRQVFEQAGEGIFLANPWGRYVEVNPRGCAMLGYTREELLQMTMNDLVAPEELQTRPLQIKKLSPGQELVVERTFRRKDGDLIYVEISGTRLSDGSLLGMVRDVTERKKAELALAESESLYRELFELESDAILLCDCDTGEILAANGAAVKMYGYSLEELFQMNNLQLSAEATETSRVIQAGRGQADSVTHVPLRYHRKKYGSTFPVEVNVRFFRRNERNVYLATIRDITERVEAEKILRESEIRYRSIVQMALDGFLLLSQTGQILDVNEAYCRMSGYSREDLVKMHISEVEVNEVYEEVEKHAKQVVEAGFDQFETAHRRKDGSIFFVEVSTNFLPLNGGVFYSFIHDVTDRKRIEADLKKNESQLRLVMDNSPVFIAYVNAKDQTYEFVNQHYLIAFGKKSDEIIGKTVRSLLGEAAYAHALPYIQSAIEGQVAWYENTFNLTYGTRVVQLNYVPEITENGQVRGLVILGHDVTEMREAEAAIRASEEKFSRAFKYAPILITISALENGQYVDVNQKFLDVSGFTREEIIGKTSTEIGWISLEDRTRLLEQLKQAGRITNLELVLQTKSGRKITCLYNGEIIQLDGKERLLSMAQDITERKKAEQTLRDSEFLLRETHKIGKFGHYVFDIPAGTWTSSELLDEIFGIETTYPRDVQHWLEIIHPEHRTEMIEYLNNYVLGERRGFDKEYRIRRISDQADLWVHGLGRLDFDAQNSPIRMIGTIQDITDRKNAENLLKAAYHEKETLLRELYHRTKNNMQVISALLSLESDNIHDPQVQGIFKDMENRIKSMALVHQMLYQSQSLSSINLKEYIGDLAGLLSQSYEFEAKDIEIALDLEDVPVLIDTAIPCGLLINELISNAFKHAFPENRSGKITISLRQSPEKDISIKVSDNGIGVPEGFDFREQESLGVQTILALAEHQLQGKVTFINLGGISCLVEFKDAIYEARI